MTNLTSSASSVHCYNRIKSITQDELSTTAPYDCDCVWRLLVTSGHHLRALPSADDRSSRMSATAPNILDLRLHRAIRSRHRAPHVARGDRLVPRGAHRRHWRVSLGAETCSAPPSSQRRSRPVGLAARTSVARQVRLRGDIDAIDGSSRRQRSIVRVARFDRLSAAAVTEDEVSQLAVLFKLGGHIPAAWPRRLNEGAE